MTRLMLVRTRTKNFKQSRSYPPGLFFLFQNLLLLLYSTYSAAFILLPD